MCRSRRRSAISLSIGRSTVFVRKQAKTFRKQAKTYGTCRLAEGADVEGKKVVLIEDVITTGGAVRSAALALRERGATVDLVICAIDRSTAGIRPLQDIGIEIQSVLTRQDLEEAGRL